MPSVAPRLNDPDLAQDWQARLAVIVDTMKEMSRQTDPQQMVQLYGQRMQQMLPTDGRISLSRRGLEFPQVRITRHHRWGSDYNPWKDAERRHIVSGGLFAELIYSDQPRVLSHVELAENDPAAEYLEGHQTILALPLYDQGVAMNMVLLTWAEPHAFALEDLPERVWMANLFGRATQNLVMAEQLETAYRAVDRELQVVADIQRSLLPAELPQIPTLEVAAHYATSKHAGGDYYDFFPLGGGRWGILVADVSGHGTPAAVVMAITHCIAHLHCERNHEPSQLLNFLNHHLSSRYTNGTGHFVTAFYAVYDPATRLFRYASAGHNPPRLRHCGHRDVVALDHANYLPMGIAPDLEYRDAELTLRPGDRLVLYTDGITEAANQAGELFGTTRLDMVVADCRDDARVALEKVLTAVAGFTGGQPASDDRTLIVVDVS